MEPVHSKEDIFDRLRHHRAELVGLRVADLSLFGSSARGEQTPESDVDLIVEYRRPAGLLHHVKVKQFLESILGREVDLATDDAIHPAMRDQVMAEIIHAA